MLRQVLGVGLVAFFLLGNSDAAKIPTKVTDTDYVVLEMYPPISNWHLSYDEAIPAGAKVQWYLRNGDNVQVVTGGQFETSEASKSLSISKDDFYCGDFSDEANYHKLYVIVTAPSFSLISGSKLGGSGCKAVQPLPDPN